MPTIEDVRVAEKKMKDILAGLRKDDLLNSDAAGACISFTTDGLSWIRSVIHAC
jgi:hypothetical protein